MVEILLSLLFLTFLDFAFTFASGKRTFFKYVSLWPKWIPMDLPNWNLRAYLKLWFEDATCESCGEVLIKDGMAVKGGIQTLTLRITGRDHSNKVGDLRVTLCYHQECFSKSKANSQADLIESVLRLKMFGIPCSNREFKACLSWEFNKLDAKDRISLDSIVPGDVLKRKPLWELRKS